eukprot:7038402-Lingulodinium_polyedra.AAC.1
MLRGEGGQRDRGVAAVVTRFRGPLATARGEKKNVAHVGFGDVELHALLHLNPGEKRLLWVT